MDTNIRKPFGIGQSFFGAGTAAAGGGLNVSFSDMAASALKCVIFPALLALGPAPVAAEPAAFDAEWRQVTARFDRALAANDYVGGSLYFMHRGSVVGAHHYGLQTLEPARRVDADTIYHWASITKTLTAIGVMQLRDRGLLSLDEPVVDYIPALRQIHNPYGDMTELTLRHLITHTSGLRGPTFPWGGSESWHPHEPVSWSQFDAMLPYTRLEFPPGSEYSYSNPGTSLLGRVIEVVTGDDIEVYLDKNVLKPLGMYRSYFDITPWHLQQHRSDNFFVENGVPKSNGIDFDTGITAGNGGLNGPVGDMALFLNFLLHAGDRSAYDGVLSRASLEAMWEPLHLSQNLPDMDEHMATHFFVINYKGGKNTDGIRYIGHTGGQLGFQSFVYVHPESGTAAIMAVNSRSASMERAFYRRTRKLLFERIFPLFPASSQ